MACAGERNSGRAGQEKRGGKNELSTGNIARTVPRARSRASDECGNLAAFITQTAQLQVELQVRLAGLAWLRTQRLVPHIDPTISKVLAFHMVNDPGVPKPLDSTTAAAKWECMIAILMRDTKAPAVIP